MPKSKLPSAPSPVGEGWDEGIDVGYYRFLPDSRGQAAPLGMTRQSQCRRTLSTGSSLSQQLHHQGLENMTLAHLGSNLPFDLEICLLNQADVAIGLGEIVVPGG